MRTTTRARVTAVATATVLLAACGGGEQDPDAALQSAFEELAGSSFAFAASLDPAEGADPQMAATASAVAVTGVVSDGDVEGSVRALGTNLLTARVVDDTAYLRVDVPSISALAGGGFTPEDIELLLGDVPADARPAVEAIAEGRFVELPSDALGDAVEGAGGQGVVEGFVQGFVEGAVEDGEIDPEAAEEAARRLVEEFSDVEQVIERYLVVTEAGSADEQRELDVQLAVHVLGERLIELGQELDPDVTDERVAEFRAELTTELPELVPLGTVEITDGVLSRVRLDLQALVAAMDAGAATDVPFALVVDIDDVGDVDPVEAPQDAVELPASLLDQLGEQAGAAGF